MFQNSFTASDKERKMFVKSQAIGVFVGFTVAFMTSSVSIFVDISLFDIYGYHLFNAHLYLLNVRSDSLRVENFVQTSLVFSGLITSQRFLRYFSSHVLEVFLEYISFQSVLKINSHPHDQSPKLTYQALISHFADWTIT